MINYIYALDGNFYLSQAHDEQSVSLPEGADLIITFHFPLLPIDGPDCFVSNEFMEDLTLRLIALNDIIL